VPPTARAARPRGGGWERNSKRRIPLVLEITPEERKLAREYLDPPDDHWTQKGEEMFFITRWKKYVAESGVIPARMKGVGMVFAERVDPKSGETTRFSYAELAAMIGSPRDGKISIARRTAIALVADFEAYGLMETEVRRPVSQRDPMWPKNWKCRFRLVFPPHARDGDDAQREVELVVEDDVDDVDGVVDDEPRSRARASIEAEAAGREPPHEDLDDVAAADEPAAPAPTLFEKAALAMQRVAGTARSGPASSLPPRAAYVPTPIRVEVVDSAAAPSELELAISAVRLRSAERAIAEILGLYSKAFSSLPRDFARTTSELLLREGHSLTKALNGIEQSLRKSARLHRQRLAAFVVACIVNVTGDPTTASKAGKRIVRAVEADQANEIMALQLAARGCDPPSARRA
jgi:hypothetical protein